MIFRNLLCFKTSPIRTSKKKFDIYVIWFASLIRKLPKNLNFFPRRNVVSSLFP